MTDLVDIIVAADIGGLVGASGRANDAGASQLGGEGDGDLQEAQEELDGGKILPAEIVAADGLLVAVARAAAALLHDGRGGCREGNGEDRDDGLELHVDGWWGKLEDLMIRV